MQQYSPTPLRTSLSIPFRIVHTHKNKNNCLAKSHGTFSRAIWSELSSSKTEDVFPSPPSSVLMLFLGMVICRAHHRAVQDNLVLLLRSFSAEAKSRISVQRQERIRKNTIKINKRISLLTRAGRIIVIIDFMVCITRIYGLC